MLRKLTGKFGFKFTLQKFGVFLVLFSEIISTRKCSRRSIILASWRYSFRRS